VENLWMIGASPVDDLSAKKNSARSAVEMTPHAAVRSAFDGAFA